MCKQLLDICANYLISLVLFTPALCTTCNCVSYKVNPKYVKPLLLNNDYSALLENISNNEIN